MIEHRITAATIDLREQREEGSIHEDDTARVYGFQGALVPGIVVGAWIMEPLCDLWGHDWLERGTLELKNVRPVYAGQEVVLQVDPDGQTAAVKALSAAGELMAVGSAALPDTPPAVDPDDYPFRPLPDPRSLAVPGAIGPGTPLGGSRVVLDAEYLRPLLSRAQATHPLLTGDHIHPLAFQQTSTFDSVDSFDYATPGIHAWGETIHLGAIPVGAELASAGRITDVWEKNGNHYMRTEQLVTADGRPAALVRRNVIYWLAKTAA